MKTTLDHEFNAEFLYEAAPWPIEIGKWAELIDESLDRTFNLALCVMLLAPAVPVLACLYLVHLAVTRRHGPFLYRGVRLGRDKIPFTIYKIRTLRSDAEQALGCQIYTAAAGLHTAYGEFLRRVRLDELPQLFNILKGDMDFVGPRPVRPVVYEERLRGIPGYDRRFAVRPGLTGVSQFYTPHGAPKRMRVLLDNRFLRRHPDMTTKAGLIGLTAFRFVCNTAREIGLVMRRTVRRMLCGRASRPERYGHVVCEIHVTCRREPLVVPVHGMDGASLFLDLPQDLQAQDELSMCLVHRDRRRPGRVHRIRCSGNVRMKTATGGCRPTERVVDYKPVTEFNQYKLEKYVLRASFG